MTYRLAFALVVTLLASCALAQRGPNRNTPADNLPEAVKRYEGKYHILFTDLSEEEVVEVLVRMTAMCEEYHSRTRDFSGAIREKLPFYLFRNPQDYYAAGGMPGSAGVYDPNRRRLMAIAGPKLTEGTWHVIQHEGFHQFADAVIGGSLPPWVNEGMAEYFGQAFYTGDGFQAGLMPNWRTQRIQAEIKEKKFKSIPNMMKLSQGEWNDRLAVANYDQAWAMTQFLAHGDDGRYQKAFGKFMIALSQGQPWPRAWQTNFGPVAGMEEAWEKWWLSRPEQPTLNLYGRAVTASLTSLLARSVSQKTNYDNFAEFRKALSGPMPHHAADALPKSFPGEISEILDALEKQGATFTFELDKKKQQMVVCTMKDGTKYVGSFKLTGKRVKSVEVEDRMQTSQ